MGDGAVSAVPKQAFETLPGGRADARRAGLDALEARLREDLERLCLPAPDWLARPADDEALDVAIVGGGMSGLAAAAALWLLGVHRIRVFDRSPAGEAGPWVTHARMETLRSPKHLTGPALGLPSLTFRAWYEAQHGRDRWDALGRIPRVMWQAYLDWFRTVLGLPVSHDTRIDAIGPARLGDGTLAVGFDARAGDGPRRVVERIRARHLVLATGMDGLGGPAIPDVARSLPRERWQHSTERIDFAALRGRRLGVVGGGDSALDAAATALEAGAAEVLVFVRAKDFARINYWKAFAHPGHYIGFPELPVRDRQPILDFLKAQKVPPARGTVHRLAAFDNVRLHFNSPVVAAAVADGPGAISAVRLRTPHGEYPVDHVVFATGYRTDPSMRPELAELAPHIRFWSERGPDVSAGFPLEGFPDLEEDFSLRARDPAACSVLAQVHLFTGAALMSLGKLTGDIPGISHGADRLARGIAARLYAADRENQLRAVRSYDELEVRGDEWARIRVDHPSSEGDDTPG